MRSSGPLVKGEGRRGWIWQGSERPLGRLEFILRAVRPLKGSKRGGMESVCVTESILRF